MKMANDQNTDQDKGDKMQGYKEIDFEKVLEDVDENHK